MTSPLDKAFNEMKEELRHLVYCIDLNWKIEEEPPYLMIADIARRSGGQLNQKSIKYNKDKFCWYFILNNSQVHDSVMKMWPEIWDIKRAS